MSQARSSEREVYEQAVREFQQVLDESERPAEDLRARAAQLRVWAAETELPHRRETWLDAAARYEAAAGRLQGR